MTFVTVVQSAMISKHLDGICLDIKEQSKPTNIKIVAKFRRYEKYCGR